MLERPLFLLPFARELAISDGICTRNHLWEDVITTFPCGVWHSRHQFLFGLVIAGLPHPYHSTPDMDSLSFSWNFLLVGQLFSLKFYWLHSRTDPVPPILRNLPGHGEWMPLCLLPSKLKIARQFEICDIHMLHLGLCRQHTTMATSATQSKVPVKKSNIES